MSASLLFIACLLPLAPSLRWERSRCCAGQACWVPLGTEGVSKNNRPILLLLSTIVKRKLTTSCKGQQLDFLSKKPEQTDQYVGSQLKDHILVYY